MDRRDLIYDIADREGAKNFEVSGFYYQATTAKSEKWKGANTHRHADLKISKHSQYAFGNYKKDTWDPEYANTLPRFGSLYIDIDDANDIPGALKTAQDIVKTFIDMGVPETALICCVSGSKGASIFLDSRVMGEKATQGHIRLPYIHGSVVNSLFPRISSIDHSVYKGLKKGRLVRAINVQRENGRYRANVSTKTFISLSVEDLEKIADKPGAPLFYDPDITVVPAMERIFNQAAEETLKTINNQSPYRGVTTTKSQQLENGMTILSDIGNCSILFNTLEEQKYDQRKRFNELSFLCASLLYNHPPESAIVFEPFFNVAKSDTYGNPQARKDHFLSQLIEINKKEIRKPFCNAIRKVFGGAPCQGCKYMNQIKVHMGKVYSFSNDGTSVVVTNQKGESSDNILTNCQVIFRDQRTVYDDQKKVNAVHFVFDVFKSDNRFTVELTSDELISNDALEKSVLKQTRGNVFFSTTEKKPAVLIFQIALSEHAYLGESQSFHKIGFFGFEKYVYSNAAVVNGGVNFYDNDIVIPPTGSKAKLLRWSKKTLLEISSAVKKQLKLLRLIHKDKIVLPIHAFAFLPIIAEFIGAKTRFYIIIIGMSGDSKTTLSRCAGNFWGNFWGLGKLLAASATANSLEVEASQFGQSMIIFDDVKQANISNITSFRRVIQNYADGTPRSRLKSDGTPIISDPILGYILMSGEDHFAGNETSIQGRGLELNITEVKKDSQIYEQLEKNSQDVNGALPYFIAFMQRQKIKDFKEKFNEANSYYIKSLSDGENKERISYSLALLDFSMWCFSIWALQELNWSKLDCDELYSSTRLVLSEIGNEQALNASNLVAANVFLTTMSELISTGKFRVEVENSLDDNGKTNIVARAFSDQKDKIYFIPSASYAAVKETCEKMGNSFAFSLKALAINLDRLNYLSDRDAGKLTKRRRYKSSNLEYWVIEKKYLSMSDESSASVRGDLPLMNTLDEADYFTLS